MKSISVIVPAHNEEKYVERCIRSIRTAAGSYEGEIEIIVVCNRCTDNTAKLAEQCGARVIYNEDRCIAKVRNAGINAAKRNTAFCVKTSLSIPLKKFYKRLTNLYEYCIIIIAKFIKRIFYKEELA